jgi:hypothetical protein
MKNIFFILCAVTLISCGPKSAVKQPEKAVADGYHVVNIKSVNTDFSFPVEYEKHTIRTVAGIFYDSTIKIDNRFFLEAIITMFQEHPKMEVLFREDDVFDQIIFKREKYFKPSTLSGGYGLGMIKSELERSFGLFGCRVEVLDSKMIRSKTTQILKGKFKLSSGMAELFWTQYIVTVNLKTFSVLVVNDTGVDFEKEIKSMKVY